MKVWIGLSPDDVQGMEFDSIRTQRFNRKTDIATLQDVWMSLIEHLGEYKDLGHCECCGDWISNYTLEI